MFGASVRPTGLERTKKLAGDGFLPNSRSTTHAITIRRPPNEVWPWLSQMGAGRAGWYSYDIIDNGGRDSAESIQPALQDIRVGSVLPALPNVTDAFTVLQLEPEHSLVLGWLKDPGGPPAVTWSLILERGAKGETRLIERGRVGPDYRPYGLPRWLAVRLAPIAHAVMVRKHMNGIKNRVERNSKTVEMQK
jgi:hypothetical protein